MKNLEKIEIGTDNRVFDWILEDEINITREANLSKMIRKLIHRHNQMVDQINKLTTIIESKK